MITEEQLQEWEQHPTRIHLDSGTSTNDMVARQEALIAEVRRLRRIEKAAREVAELWAGSVPDFILDTTIDDLDRLLGETQSSEVDNREPEEGK